MRKLAICFALLISVPALQAMVQAGVQVGPDEDAEDQVEVWVGPGFYYGIWFDNEWEYNNWYHNHYHHYRDGDYHGGHDHHGGGGHGGGGHR